MPKYDITVTTVELATVEADSLEEAEKMADSVSLSLDETTVDVVERS